MRFLIPLLVISFLFRLYHLAYPLGDIHSWRQSDTAAVARSLYHYGPSLWLPLCQPELRHIGAQGIQCRVPLLNPQIDSFVTIDGKATWMDGRQHTNDTRNHFAEFPLYQALVAQTALFFDAVPGLQRALISLSIFVDSAVIVIDTPPNVDKWKEVAYQSAITQGTQVDGIIFSGRVVSIVASLLSIVFLYLWVRRYFQERVALLAAGIFGLLPYTVFWSRTVLPDTTMLLFVLSGFYFLHRVFDVPSGRYKQLAFGVLSVVCLAIALLMKVFVVFFVLPMVYLLFITKGVSLFRNWKFILGLFLTLLPFVFWRWWIQSDNARLPGIPSSDWLFNGSGVRLKPAWWYWLFQTRLDHFMFNFPGLGLVMIGVFFYKEVWEELGVLTKKTLAQGRVLFGYTWSVYLVWLFTLIACFGYLVVFATGNVQHEYYQLPLVPFLAVFASLGFWYVWSLRSGWVGILQKGMLGLLLVLMVLFGSNQVKNWYGQRMPSYIYAGQRADAVVPEDAIVVADFGGDTTMLYYANRPGWSIVEFSFDELIRKGATHYISAFRSDGVNELAKQYTVVEETPEYVILDLRL